MKRRRHRKPYYRFKDLNRVAKTTDRKAYLRAKSELGFKRNDVNNWPGYCSIVTAFYSIIADKIIENTEGVFIEGLGYFSVIVRDLTASSIINKPTLVRTGVDEGYINSHTDGLVFSLSFTPISKSKKKGLQDFLMDGGFSRTLRKRFSDALLSGKKYRNNVALFFNRRIS